MEENTTVTNYGFITLSVSWFISTVIVWICGRARRRREREESIVHRQQMARLERLRRSRREQGLDPGEGEEFDELYAQEREQRRKREQLKREKRKRKAQETRDVDRVDAHSVRDVLRQRIKGEGGSGSGSSSSSRRRGLEGRGTDQHAQQQSGGGSSGSKPGKKKPGGFRSKLRELAMSPRSKRKQELEILRSEATQEASDELRGGRQKSEHSATAATAVSSRNNSTTSTEESQTGISQRSQEKSGSWLFKSARTRRMEQLQRERELRQQVRDQTISPKRKKLAPAEEHMARGILASPAKAKTNDDVSTARSRTGSISEHRRKDHKNHSRQTARSVVEEDLKQRLQQMDFKLTPSEGATTDDESVTLDPTSMSPTGKGSGSRGQRRKKQSGTRSNRETEMMDGIRQADSPKYSDPRRKRTSGRRRRKGSRHHHRHRQHHRSQTAQTE